MIKIFEYYNTDINDKKYHYTAFPEDVSDRTDRCFSGKVFIAELPQNVTIKKDNGGDFKLWGAANQPLIIKRGDNKKFYLLSELGILYGKHWTDCIYSEIKIKEEVTD